MILDFIFRILEMLYPTYWEITTVNYDGRQLKQHFLTKRDAEISYIKSQNRYGVSIVTIDKYINIQGKYLVKVSREHK